MPTIEELLPLSARQHYHRLRRHDSNKATAIHRDKLAALRQQMAAKGTRSAGHLLLDEWKLTEGLIANLAAAWFEAATEAAKLYCVPFDQQLCVCIEQTIRDFVDAQYRNAIRSPAYGQPRRMASAAALDFLKGRIPPAKFLIMNEVQIRLDRARVNWDQNEQKVGINAASGARKPTDTAS